MLPIIDGCSKNYFSVKTYSGRKKYIKSYSFHLDTGDVAQKAGHSIQDAAEKGYNVTARFIRTKYRDMKVEKALKRMKKSLDRKITRMPLEFKILKTKVMHAMHA